jgi:glycosyltransferase involved in cell wall biosynthesis
MPEISVVIPVYNTAKFLAQCLDSVIHQTFTDFEAIIVDDGSTDNSIEIDRYYAGHDTRFRILQQENKGLSEARNAGLDIARGEWITFVDSDDMIAPNFLQTLFNAIMETGANIACSGKHLFGDIKPKRLRTHNENYISLSPAAALANALYQNDKPDYSAWNKLYAANLWKGRRFPPRKFFEDMATIPQVFLDARLIAFVPEPLYLNRRHSTSILATSYDRKKAELLDIAETVCHLVAGKGTGLEKAARSNLFSASCSILMRTGDTPEFADYRERAWKHIKELRLGALFNPRTRGRNKAAALISFAGKEMLVKALRRHG